MLLNIYNTVRTYIWYLQKSMGNGYRTNAWMYAVGDLVDYEIIS